MTTNNIIVLCAFIAYMIIMIVIGFVCSKGNKNNEDYFLGGRNLGSWTAAMSAQASDMSGWLFGSSGRCIPCRHRRGMDCRRTSYRHNSQLVHCFGKTS